MSQSTVILSPDLSTRERSAPLRFDMRELAGSLGDMGTFLPLAVAMTVSCGMDLGLILIFAGLMNIVTGWWLRQPIPVQPMKAIAAIAIAEGLTHGQIAAAGLLMAMMVLALALTGTVDRIGKWVPQPLIRGLQAGIGLKLAWTGVQWIGALPVVALDGWLVALLVAGLLLMTRRLRQPMILHVFLLGFVILALTRPAALASVSLRWPHWGVYGPHGHDWWIGLTRAAVVQLPLTLLNSVVAVCALSADYFPGRGIAPRRMATSVALMNLVCVPLGGMPMCHGAGGLAAQYHFGARTGGSVVMLGAAKVVAGLFFGSALLTLLASYPRSVLGVMVIVAGITLASAARDCRGKLPIAIAVLTAAAILLTNTFTGFIVGCATYGVAVLLRRAWERER